MQPGDVTVFVIIEQDQNTTVDALGMDTLDNRRDHFLDIIGKSQLVGGCVQALCFFQGAFNLFQQLFADQGVGKSV
ncbi:hypothetical protein SDC9_71387 [bioreactor metagenome]|uniref:Uncharacterized protein n=1 Tax=bioreactor metagenome TaxID=1076179 RepID=A0A644Y9B8_9ZZZZ